jgi:hypothetical protein
MTAEGKVIWGITGCSRGECDKLAEAHLEGFGYLCLGCVEAALERVEAIYANGRMRELLPAWDDGAS